MTSPLAISRETAVGAEARLSWILSGLAGMVGAVAFLHSAGYFVTFMTGNTERAVVGHFGHPEGKEVAPGASPWAALALMAGCDSTGSTIPPTRPMNSRASPR